MSKKNKPTVDEVYIFSLWYYPSHFGIHIDDIATAFNNLGIKTNIVTVTKDIFNNNYFNDVRHMFINSPIKGGDNIKRVGLTELINRNIYTPILIPKNLETLKSEITRKSKVKKIMLFHIFEAFAPYFNKAVYPYIKSCHVFYAGNYISRTLKLLGFSGYDDTKLVSLIIDANMSHLYSQDETLIGIDAVISETHSLVKMFNDAKPKIPAYFVPRPFNMNNINISKDVDLRKQFSLCPNSILLAYAGRPTKNTEVLLEILYRLNTKFKQPVYLVLIGTQNFDISNWKYFDKVEKQIINIDYLQRSSLFNYLKKCDVLVYPGLIDGYPKIVSESQYLGLPVVAFKSPASGVEEIINNGKTGFVVNEKDVSSFVQKITDLIKNKTLYENIRKNAYDYVRFNFSDKNFVTEIEKISSHIKSLS
jgi:glycosyltransferase involved in cell wall biosynthesis